MTLLTLINAIDVRATSEENFNRIKAVIDGGQNIPFSSESPIITDYYVGGRYRWAEDKSLLSATVVCAAPVGAGISFTLEINGVLTAKVLTVASAGTSAEIDLSDLDPVPAGQYVRWKCTASPAVEDSASQIHITTNLE